MKRFFTAFSFLAVFALAACGGSNAQAQTLGTQFQFGGNKTVDLANAQSVSLASPQIVIDHNGNKITGTFVTSPQAMMALAFFQANYVPQSAGSMTFYNVTQMLYVDCIGGQSVIQWAVGRAETSQGCDFASAVAGRAKR